MPKQFPGLVLAESRHPLGKLQEVLQHCIFYYIEVERNSSEASVCCFVGSHEHACATQCCGGGWIRSQAQEGVQKFKTGHSFF